jgi:hypothetical protein
MCIALIAAMPTANAEQRFLICCVIQMSSSALFRDQQLPVDTAMCDNFVGWGNLRRIAWVSRRTSALFCNAATEYDRDRIRQSIAYQVLHRYQSILRLLRLSRRTQPNCSCEFCPALSDAPRGISSQGVRLHVRQLVRASLVLPAERID